METDRIEKVAVLKAPRSRVWRAISDSGEFGAWFGIRLTGAFAPGVVVRGHIATPGDYEGLALAITVEQVVEGRLLSYRWHPYAVDPKVDYSSEPTTLVEFRLDDDAGGGTRLTIVESGFDRIPPARRAQAFRMNDGGWTAQVANIARYVSG